MQREDQVIDVLQAGRAVAALAVLGYHAAFATRDFAAPVPADVFHTFELGNYGVDFFFVLSGFIILHAHADDPRGLEPAAAYLRKRLIRIFVPYLPVSLAMMGLYLAFPDVSGSGRGWSALTSLTLVPTGSPPALAAAWTLVHETMFYAVFLLSYAVRGFRWIVAAWMGLILGGVAVGLETSFAAPSWLSLLAPINAEFVAGMIAAWAVARFSPSWAWPALALGTAGIAAFFAIGIDPAGPARMSLGVALALVIAGGVWLERAGRLAVPTWLLLLGNASYAIYLVHGPLCSIGARLAGGFGAPGGWPAGIALCVALGLAGGLAYHLAYERPALALVRGRRPRPAVAREASWRAGGQYTPPVCAARSAPSGTAAGGAEGEAT